MRWTKKKKAAFLDHLSGACNVKAASVAIAVDPASAYALRRRDAEFAAQWRTAIVAGYEVLETELVAHAMGGGDGTIVDGTGARIQVALALQLLTAHRNAMAGKTIQGGPKRHRATIEETDNAILARLALIARRRPES